MVPAESRAIAVTAPRRQAVLGAVGEDPAPMEDAHAGGEVADPQRGVRQSEQDVGRVRRESLARRGLESLEAHAVELEEAALRGDPEHAVRPLRQIPDRARRPVLHPPRGMRVLGEVERLCSQTRRTGSTPRRRRSGRPP